VYLHDARSIFTSILEISIVMHAYWLVSLPHGWTRLRREYTTIKQQGGIATVILQPQSRRHDPKG
jgi:hypothetical protein